MWTRLREQQQRGAQMGARGLVEAPDEATRDRAAQQHDEADQQVAPDQPGAAPAVYPAGRLQDEPGDNTPTAPEAQAGWDETVQPARKGNDDDDDLPLPEGK